MMASHNAGSDFVWKLVNHCQPTSTVDGDLLSWLPNSKLKPIHKSLEIKYPSQIDIYIIICFYFTTNWMSNSVFFIRLLIQLIGHKIKTMMPLFKSELQLMMGQLFKHGSNNLQCSSMLIFLYWLHHWSGWGILRRGTNKEWIWKDNE